MIKSINVRLLMMRSRVATKSPIVSRATHVVTESITLATKRGPLLLNGARLVKESYSTSTILCSQETESSPIKNLQVTVSQTTQDQTPPISLDEDEDDDLEDMYVEPDESLGVNATTEWGGPRRGGKYSEPTRFGDWERQGRCTDF